MNELLPIRLSHLLRYCSVGAIVRGPDALMTVMDTRQWTDRNGKEAGRPLRYVDRVRSALEIEQELREPPIAKEGLKGQVDGVCIPARKFPRWGRCSYCGLLHFLPSLKDKSILPQCRERDSGKCPAHPRMEQVAYVLVHEEGNMDDVPWHFLAHLDSRNPSQSQCKADSQRHYLRLISEQGDKSKLLLSCSRCGAKNRFNPFGLAIAIKVMRRQPWLNESVELQTPPQIMKVNHIQIHHPCYRNALVIPPESRIQKGTVVDRLYNSTEKRRLMEICRTKLQWKSTLRRLATEFRCTTEAVETAWKQIQDGYPLYGQMLNLTPGQLREDEYKALIQVIPDVTDDEDFVTFHQTEQWQSLSETFHRNSLEGHISRAINRLVAVNRLKEIMVFEGFKRVDSKGVVVKPDILGKSEWLPAIELFGEGMFITLDESIFGNWEKLSAIVERAELAQKRYDAATQFINDELTEISPRFLLLHTFAHLLIRQLENDCGYPTASLKERLYFSNGSLQMAGILIYVAVPDIVGSLGGIVEIGEPRRFLTLASRAIARSQWCSLDPVCSEHEGQGLHLLNRSACHACLLVPEPACDYRNALLDRVLVKGNTEKGIPGFFESSDFGGDNTHG